MKRSLTEFALRFAWVPLVLWQPLLAVGAGYSYLAETAGPAKRSGQVVAAGITWSCARDRCTTSGPWPSPGVPACRALAKQIGAIRSYGHAEKKLNAAELAQCNAGVGTDDTQRVQAKSAQAPRAAEKASTPPGRISAGGTLTITGLGDRPIAARADVARRISAPATLTITGMGDRVLGSPAPFSARIRASGTLTINGLGDRPLPR